MTLKAINNQKVEINNVTFSNMTLLQFNFSINQLIIMNNVIFESLDLQQNLYAYAPYLYFLNNANISLNNISIKSSKMRGINTSI